MNDESIKDFSDLAHIMIIHSHCHGSVLFAGNRTGNMELDCTSEGESSGRWQVSLQVQQTPADAGFASVPRHATHQPGNSHLQSHSCHTWTHNIKETHCHTCDQP